jgi:hypothetical protein
MRAEEEGGQKEGRGGRRANKDGGRRRAKEEGGQRRKEGRQRRKESRGRKDGKRSTCASATYLCLSQQALLHCSCCDGHSSGSLPKMHGMNDYYVRS